MRDSLIVEKAPSAALPQKVQILAYSLLHVGLELFSRHVSGAF
jgi:hypothetical protein